MNQHSFMAHLLTDCTETVIPLSPSPTMLRLVEFPINRPSKGNSQRPRLGSHLVQRKYMQCFATLVMLYVLTKFDIGDIHFMMQVYCSIKNNFLKKMDKPNYLS